MQSLTHAPYKQTHPILMVCGATLCWMTGSLVVQHLAERAALLALSWGDLAWMVLLGAVIGVALTPTLRERFLKEGEASHDLSTRQLLVLAAGLFGLSLAGTLLLPMLPAVIIWSWHASAIVGVGASVFLFLLLHTDAAHSRPLSWRSEVPVGAALVVATMLCLLLWVVVSGPYLGLLVAWLAAVALVSLWLWCIHLLAHTVR